MATLDLSYIDNLSTPLIERQERINTYVLTKIATRIKDIGMLLPSDLHSLEQLVRTGSDIQQIEAYLAQQTAIEAAQIESMIDSVGAISYNQSLENFTARNLQTIPYSENTRVKQVAETIAKQTADTYRNIANTTAFVKRDKITGQQVVTPVAKAYREIVDDAIQANANGLIDYNTVIRGALEELMDSGLRRVDYPSGYTQRLDTAVRRNILDGVRAVNQGVQDEVGKQFGADGVEIMVHANSAPDHEPVQGHQFTNEEFKKLQNGENFEDLQKRKFIGFDRAIGMWNCRHFTFSIICGVTKPNYTDEQLEKFKEENQEGYTFPDGRHFTMYECTQHQRKLELKVRRLKEKQIVTKTAGNIDLALQYQAQIKQIINEYGSFSQACGLKPRYDKMRVLGYKEIKQKV